MSSDSPTNSARLTGREVGASPGWRSLALAWVDDQLTAWGGERTGPAEAVRVQAWSTVLRVPTTAGQVWFKAAGPATSFEVPLYQFLHQAAPQLVLPPIAADTARGWILLPDGGRPLADWLTRTAPTAPFEAVLSRYGQVQRELAPHAPDLLALGVPDMRPALMPLRFDEAMTVARRYVARDGHESDRAAYAAVARLRDAVAGWCEVLVSSPVPPSLDHGDLHPRNILVAEAGRAQARLLDWGTSVIAHPFTSMLIPLRFVQRKLRVSDDDPAVLRARDAYLEPFRDLAPPAELVATLEAACQVGKVGRALVWVGLARAAGARGPGQKAAFQWLTYLLDDGYLGRDDRPRRERVPASRFATRPLSPAPRRRREPGRES